MDMLSMCRICLDEDVTMHSSLSIKLQDLYEKLTAMPFQTEDRRPLQVCYICHARLQSCYRLQVSCLRSEDLLTKMLANNQPKPKPSQSANTLGIEHPLVQLSCVPVTMEVHHDDEDHHDVEPMNMVDIHIKEEKIEDTEENTTEELSIQYTSPADIVKVEPVDVEDHDASGYSHHMMHQSYSLDIDSKHEVSIQHTEPALRNVDRITQNDLKPTCNMLSIEFGDNELLKPIKETSAHLVQDKKLAEEFINIQSALTRQHKTEVKYESQIKCKSKIQTGDKHMKMKKKVFRVSVTAGEKPFKCDVCEKTFMQSLYLQRHMRVHTGEKPFKCDMCKKWFKQKQHLMQHIRIHTGEKPYKCNICEKRFNQKYNLTQHNRLHTGEKPYICDMCNKSFNQKHNLIRHIKVHTGEKPYKCDLCEKCFMQRQDLTRHTRIHTGEKPYKCDVCGKAFNGSQTLKQHLRIHTGEKPFKCDICDEYFRMKPSLSRHMWMQHRGGCSLGPYCEDAVDPASILTHTSLESVRTEHMSRDQD